MGKGGASALCPRLQQRLPPPILPLSALTCSCSSSHGRGGGLRVGCMQLPLLLLLLRQQSITGLAIRGREAVREGGCSVLCDRDEACSQVVLLA